MKRNHATYFRIAVIFLSIVVIGTLAGGLRTGSNIPDIVVAVTALIGVFALYAESRRGKNIAMGEFILSLNSEFTQDEQRADIHRKLIAGERLGPGDKPAIVSYLTFFEIINRLLTSEVVRMDVIDDLFRSRFFTAAYSVDVQDLELLPDADGYRNIFDLERRWLDHLTRQGIALKRGERPLPESARRRAADQVRFSLSYADQGDLHAIHDLIVAAGRGTGPEHFFVNDKETLSRQMTAGFTVLAHVDGELAGLLHVHFPAEGEGFADLIDDDYPTDAQAKMDIAAALPNRRGYGMLEILLIEAEARIMRDFPERLACYATVSSSNHSSRRSFEFSGYERVGKIEIHGSHSRDLFRKVLLSPVPTSPVG